jgi:antitoxin component of MazEF toxin-antitoxin module
MYNMVEVELREWGNSVGIILPSEKLKELKLKKGDKVDIDIVKKERIDAFGICKGAKPFEEEKEAHEELW